MRDTQGDGVFAISSACHRRRRIAASQWTLRVVCVGELRECGAPHVRHLDSLSETRWVPHLFTFMMDIVLAYLYLVWQCTPLMQMSKLVRVPHYVDRCDLSVRDFNRGCLEFTVGFLRNEAGQPVDETDTNKCRGIFVKKSRQILL